jgi:hypothetical protein
MSIPISKVCDRTDKLSAQTTNNSWMALCPECKLQCENYAASEVVHLE